VTLKIKNHHLFILLVHKLLNLNSQTVINFFAGSFMKSGKITGFFEFYKRIKTGWTFNPVLFLNQKFSFCFLNKIET
jgi:hypothetical protein